MLLHLPLVSRLVAAVRWLRLFVTLQVILDPYSGFKKAWDYAVICMILYNAFVIPYYIAFDTQLSVTLLPLDITCTVSMAIDIMVTLRTGFLDFSGNTCYDGWAIARRYWTRGLILDIIGTFPMDIFTSLVIGHGQRYANLLKAPGLLRASRLAYNDRLAAFNSPTARILKLLFGFFYLAHLFGSVFFFTAMVEDSQDSWVNVCGYGQASLTAQYIASLYWALTTMVTVGYGDIVPTTVYEQAVVIPILMLSALTYATIFGNMAYAIETITSTIRRYQSKLDMVKEFIKVYELPQSLQRKLFDYTTAMWNQNKGFELEAMLQHLPTSVKAEVMLHINESLIQRVPLLKQCSDRFLEAIILRMSSQVCLSGDYIFKEGDKSREMYFVRTGSVEIIMEDEQGVEQVIASLHSYSDCPFFGEISLLLGETRTASAKATSKCLLSSLSQHDFFEVLSMFPDEENSLRETASQRLQNDIDREQAAMSKHRKGDAAGKSRSSRQPQDGDDDSDDDEDDGQVKKKKGLVSQPSHAAPAGGRSKHEHRLNALEMTSIGNAVRERDRGLSSIAPASMTAAASASAAATAGDGGLAGSNAMLTVAGKERRGSASKSVAKGLTRMNRLNGGATQHDADNGETSTAPAAKGLLSRAAAASRSPRSDLSPRLSESGSDTAADGEEQTADAEMQQRVQHQKQLRRELEGSSAAASAATAASFGAQEAELERMRLRRDVGELREKGRGMEKAQLEMEDRLLQMERQLQDVADKLAQLCNAVLPSSASAAAGATSPKASAGTAPPSARQAAGSQAKRRSGAIVVKPSPMGGGAQVVSGSSGTAAAPAAAGAVSASQTRPSATTSFSSASYPSMSQTDSDIQTTGS